MRHPDDFGKIKRQIADGTYDESAGLDAICEAFLREYPPWYIGGPVLRLGLGGDFTRDIHADELGGSDHA